jgi:hypothetical protein
VCLKKVERLFRLREVNEGSYVTVPNLSSLFHGSSTCLSRPINVTPSPCKFVPFLNDPTSVGVLVGYCVGGFARPPTCLHIVIRRTLQVFSYSDRKHVIFLVSCVCVFIRVTCMQYEYGSRFVRNSYKCWTLFPEAAGESNIILIIVLAYTPKYKATPYFPI